MFSDIARIGLAASVALVMAGCAPRSPTVACDLRALPDGAPAGSEVLASPAPGALEVDVPLNAVSMTDEEVASRILVQSTGAYRTPTGTLQVVARLVNCTDYPQMVEGRAHFLGEAQMPVGETSAWKRVHLPARAIGHYTETSTDWDRVQSYLIELRSGR
jgi:hypothetical protein